MAGLFQNVPWWGLAGNVYDESLPAIALIDRFPQTASRQLFDAVPSTSNVVTERSRSPIADEHIRLAGNKWW